MPEEKDFAKEVEAMMSAGMFQEAQEEEEGTEPELDTETSDSDSEEEHRGEGDEVEQEEEEEETEEELVDDESGEGDEEKGSGKQLRLAMQALNQATARINELEQKLTSLEGGQQKQQEAEEEAEDIEPVEFINQEEFDQIFEDPSKLNGVLNKAIKHAVEATVSRVPGIVNNNVALILRNAEAQRRVLSENADMFKVEGKSTKETNEKINFLYGFLMNKVQEVQARQPGLVNDPYKLWSEAAGEMRKAMNLLTSRTQATKKPGGNRTPFPNKSASAKVNSKVKAKTDVDKIQEDADKLAQVFIP